MTRSSDHDQERTQAQFPERNHVQSRELTPYEKKNMEVVRRALEDFWGKGMVEIADELFAKDMVRHDPHNPDIRSPEEYARMVVKYRKAFPDLRNEIDSILPDGEWVAWRATTYATHTGEFVGIKPTGAKIKVLTQTFVRFTKDSKALEAWVVSDYLGLIQTLINAMSWWQFLLNLPAIIKQSGLGRSPETEFGEAGERGWRCLFGIKG